MLTVTDAWTLIDEWLAEHGTAAVLAPPARRAEITAAEKKMGLEFPAELVEHLLCHNGCDGKTAELLPLFSVGQIVSHWERNREDPTWDPTWIPFAGTGEGGDALVVTTSGQLRQHRRDAGATSSDWFSVADYLSDTAEVLRHGPEGRMSTITESWAQIDAWLAKHSPDTAAELAPPAAPAAIAAAEQKMGLKFPPDLIETLLCHNGCDDETVLPGMSLMSVEYIVEFWEMNVGIHRDVGAASVFTDNPWWDERWIPFAAEGSDCWFIDTRNDEVGVHWHDSGAEYRGCVSIPEYLSEVADALTVGGGFGLEHPYFEEDGALLWLTESDAADWHCELRPAPVGAD